LCALESDGNDSGRFLVGNGVGAVVGRRLPLSSRLTVCGFGLNPTVLGKDGNEIRLIERSAAIKAAHRTTDALRIGSSKPRVHSEQTFKLAIGSVQVMTSVVSSRHVGASTIHKSKLMFETLQGTTL
jgi:hypothetical protein